MRVYILPVFVVVPGAPVQPYENEEAGETFTQEESAERWANWWRFDQGRRDTQVLESFVECPMVDGLVYIPEEINRS